MSTTIDWSLKSGRKYLFFFITSEKKYLSEELCWIPHVEPSAWPRYEESWSQPRLPQLGLQHTKTSAMHSPFSRCLHTFRNFRIPPEPARTWVVFERADLSFIINCNQKSIVKGLKHFIRLKALQWNFSHLHIIHALIYVDTGTDIIVRT